ncbi:uncharacterized protein A4U43_C10F5360 [Asparagus officinalis]|uniref:EDRF1 N-terminal domain-containing protein n=3 Tax=Asparagus officinalis TaxID=4686 RepID=A0A5P1E0V1_ASPOF|nr:uncharacterized protein A4U43_C10F5360 [Asparagus officinalis]
MHSVRAEACDCPPTHQPPPEKTSSTILPGCFINREDSFVSSTGSDSTESKFLDKNISGSRKSGQASHDNYYWGTKQNKHKCKRPSSVKRTSQVGEKPRGPVQDSDKFRRAGNDSFLRVMFWQFHNFRMLLGSDMLIFSNEKYVAVSLHLWDVARQVTPLTWLEAWLDNVMASVPELAICYHDNGVVQGYELLKTDDIFLLKGISDDGTPGFHPQVVQQNGLSVLKFLQDNCKQDPGAYWLYKSAGEDVIQLFDLSVMPKNHTDDDNDTSLSSLPSLIDKGRKESLFSLGTLLYRVAHRLSLSKVSDNSTKCANFFRKCLDFLHEQDHLVVRAYAHEQFARLILKCYEELELTSESFLLESEVTVTDLEDGSSEFSLEMFGSTVQDIVPSQAVEDTPSIKDRSILQSSGPNSSASTMETDQQTDAVFSATEVAGLMDDPASSVKHDSLDMYKISSASPNLTRAVADPISSKFAAIHHVSQAIKSLRWKRQLQNTQGDLVDRGNKSRDRSNLSVCGCGDANCIEVCDIREWLPKSKMDQKMWNLVLLLGESYLALGEAYKDDGQLHQALKVVKLACLVYGSMPQHLEDTQFISSMVNTSSNLLKAKNQKEKTDWVIDFAEPLEAYSTDQFSTTYLFWAKAWSLVGDVYVECHLSRNKGNQLQDQRKTSGSELRMSNEVVREVARLRKKLGQYEQNCSSCSLINCSCQSDRASSGNSASSSSRDSPSYSRKQNRKSSKRNSLHSPVGKTCDGNSSHKIVREDRQNIENLQDMRDGDTYATPVKECELRESSATADAVGHQDFKRTQTSALIDESNSESGSKVASGLKCGGIFTFLESPKLVGVENNLSAATVCYSEARKAISEFPTGAAELHSILKKMGWVCNELGRHRLENRDLGGAEIAFADAIKAFKEVSDHTNIILINCNLGHGRRALAEELVSKIDELKRHDVLPAAYKQDMKTAKLEYFESLRYYEAAKIELSSANDVPDYLSLHNEVHTQFANTYLRLGMLLAREASSDDSIDLGHSDELYKRGKNMERRKKVMSASDAFREALATYESLGNLRKQEVAFAHYHLACYHRDACLKFLDLDRKQVTLSNYETERQKAKWYASLADKHWQRSIDFYGPKTHHVMYLTILMEQSSLSWNLSRSLHSNMMLEAALLHLLEGRHAVEENKGCELNEDIKVKFLNQLQALLKSMLSASLSGGSKGGGIGSTSAWCRTADSGKLKEMYRMSLRSTTLDQLHAMYKLWVS